MPRDEINYVTLVMLVESNFAVFEYYAGGEEQAMETLNKLRQMAGMGPAK